MGDKGAPKRKKKKRKRPREADAAPVGWMLGEDREAPPLPAPLVSGHASGELWGLAAHPWKRVFVSVGDDATLRVWDVVRRRQVPNSCPLKSCPLDHMLRF